MIDLGTDAPDSLQAFVDAGMRIGSIDLAASKPMISADKAKRADAIAQNAEYITTCGAANYFLGMLPENPDLPRSENFGYMVESFGELVPVLEANNARLVIEGWPGRRALLHARGIPRAL